jgi:DNA-binding response OmpR family regulator
MSVGLSASLSSQRVTVSQQCSILIVDDEESTLLAMTEYFTSRGFAVDSAREVREAEMLAGAKSYVAVITDLQLTASHDRQGLELITYVRQRWPSVCIILLTAHGSPQVEAEARRRGVDAFLVKPQPLSAVEHTMRGLLVSRPESPQR